MTDDKMTEAEEAALGSATLAAAAMANAEDVAIAMAQFDLYRAMVSVLLGEESESALLYLRGMARIGLEVGEDQMNPAEVKAHERVMAVLVKVGVEPLTAAEVAAEQRAAAQSIQFRQSASPTPEGIRSIDTGRRLD